jgi:hypothetical protein
MSYKARFRIASLALVLSFTHYAGAQTTPQVNTPSWIAYRGDDGQLLPESTWAARAMYQKALDKGYITLWLHIDEQTIAAIGATAEEQFNQACVRILQPLVNRGEVWHPTQGPVNNGPTCLVRASANGVASLVTEVRFSQIMGANPPFLP